MGRLLPTTPDATIERSEEPRLLCIDDEQSTQVLQALSSDTSQRIFRTLNEEPMTPRDVADELDSSLQSVGYHLENLEEAGLITVLDTCYSEKGQEMKVYGPPREPLVLFFGPSDDQPGLTAAFERFAGAIGLTAVPLAIGQALARLFGADE
ncbi:ArsR/SmtB family transcription factor [Natronobacterium texcoconense]|nr:helix-turn-helix domain-containing protein [Natronobacterium texcoconense]